MENENFQFNWVSCDGGPLLLVEEKYLKNWEGSEAPSNGRIVKADFRWGLEVATDYDKACDVEDWLGLIDVGNGQGIVLGGDEAATTWFQIDKSEGVLVRWIYADSENNLIESIKSISNNSGKDENIEFIVENNNLILMAACESWNDNIYPRLKFSLQNGKYKIFTNEFSNKQTSFISHHFKKV